jgi:hypothetical protein
VRGTSVTGLADDPRSDTVGYVTLSIFRQGGEISAELHSFRDAELSWQINGRVVDK